MEYDREKVDEMVLALLWLTLGGDGRAWKGHDWDALERLHERGYISDPKTKAKSVVLSRRANVGRGAVRPSLRWQGGVDTIPKPVGLAEAAATASPDGDRAEIERGRTCPALFVECSRSTAPPSPYRPGSA